MYHQKDEPLSRGRSRSVYLAQKEMVAQQAKRRGADFRANGKLSRRILIRPVCPPALDACASAGIYIGPRRAVSAPHHRGPLQPSANCSFYFSVLVVAMLAALKNGLPMTLTFDIHSVSAKKISGPSDTFQVHLSRLLA